MHFEDVINFILLAFTGCAAGFLNVSAGGGSLLTLPILIFLGLSPAVANGTNRIAILAQNITAVARFNQLKAIPKEAILITALPALPGAIIGAQLAVDIDELLFQRILAIIMAIIAGISFLKPPHLQGEKTIWLNGKNRMILVPTFFCIGIYGGFIQGGVGFIIITALTMAGYDLVRTNALKVLVVLIFTPLALAIFIANGQVDYAKGFILSCGNATGAWIASTIVVAKGHRFTRWIVLTAMTLFALKLLFV